jgi:hypothetical protein
MKNLNKHLIFMLVAALLFGAVLTACGGEEPTPTPRVRNNDEEDEEDEEDPVEEPTEEPVEEPTEEPTAVPTEEPEPTAVRPTPRPVLCDFANEALGVLPRPTPKVGPWNPAEDSGELRLASSEDILADGQDDIQGAIMNFVFLDPVTACRFLAVKTWTLRDPVAVLNVFVELFTANSDATEGVVITVTEAPTAVTINGQDAAYGGWPMPPIRKGIRPLCSFTSS